MWTILTVIMVLIVLFFGLRPKQWPIANGARWLPDKGTLRFQKEGLAYVADLRAAGLIKRLGPWTIEMVVTPGTIHKRGRGPLLVIHDGADRRQLVIWQWGPSLIAMNGSDYDYSKRRPRIVAENVLSPHQSQYLTVTSGEQGTRLFIDAKRIAADRNWKLSIPVGENPLRLVLGNSISGMHGWIGDLHGLAISRTAISHDTVKSRFRHWNLYRNFDFLEQDAPNLIFTINQMAGTGVADDSTGGQHLVIPSKIVALQKTYLSPPWKHFYWNRDALADMALNIIGFIPLGGAMLGLLAGMSGRWLSRYKRWVALVVCLTLSLGIELSQAWIPTRVSSLTDLILNGLGAWLGIWLSGMVWARKYTDPG